MTRLVYDRGAWAVIGGVDGATTHLAVQLALKSHFLLLSPGSTDATADHAERPVALLAAAVRRRDRGGAGAGARPGRAREGTFAIAAGTDHDSHATLVALRRALGERRAAPAAVVEVAGEDADVAAAVARLLASRPQRLAIVAPPRLAARLVRAVRAAGFEGRVLGGPGLARRAFARAAGDDAEGVLAPALAEPSLDAAFFQAYEARWGEPPDAAAALGADAVRIVAAAVRSAGLNRARIRDAVRALAPWQGASGRVAWDPRGRNERPAELGVWRHGRLIPVDARRLTSGEAPSSGVGGRDPRAGPPRRARRSTRRPCRVGVRSRRCDELPAPRAVDDVGSS